MDKLLNLIGLAKKAGKLEVGEEPVGAAARSKHARLILIASDAADNTRRRALHFGEAGECICLEIPPTKEDLGRALGRTSCALLALTDIGFAEAVAKSWRKVTKRTTARRPSVWRSRRPAPPSAARNSNSMKRTCAPARKSRIRKSRSPLPPQRPRARKRARASAREARSSTDARAPREKRRTAPRKSSARQGALPIPAP